LSRGQRRWWPKSVPRPWIGFWCQLGGSGPHPDHALEIAEEIEAAPSGRTTRKTLLAKIR
jgi:hypothetical protein